MRSIFIAATATATLFSSPAFTQQPNRSTISISDFSGLWSHPSLTGFEPPLSGPGPVLNKSRLRGGPQNGRGNFNELVGDYSNPILKPEASEAVKKHGEISLAGVAYPTPSNQCWPGGVPYIFWNFGMQMLQLPDRVTIVYYFNNEFC
jgi:hypothetical protein